MSPETMIAGPSGSSGIAVAIPPAVSRGSASRDQRTRTPYALPSPISSIMRSARCETLIATSRMPARARASSCHAISGLPPTRSSGLGVTSESGRMRSPRPAARIIAPIMTPTSCASLRGRRGDALEPVEQPGERGELAVALRDGTRVVEEARRVFHVARLAIAVRDAREDAENLEMSLQAHPLERAEERREVGVDRETGAPRLLPVADRPVENGFLGPADERVLEQRHHVVADRADHRVLEVEDAGIGCRHHQVARHVVAMDEHLRLREMVGNQRFEDAVERVALVA